MRGGGRDASEEAVGTDDANYLRRMHNSLLNGRSEKYRHICMVSCNEIARLNQIFRRGKGLLLTSFALLVELSFPLVSSSLKRSLNSPGGCSNLTWDLNISLSPRGARLRLRFGYSLISRRLRSTWCHLARTFTLRRLFGIGRFTGFPVAFRRPEQVLKFTFRLIELVSGLICLCGFARVLIAFMFQILTHQHVPLFVLTGIPQEGRSGSLLSLDSLLFRDQDQFIRSGRSSCAHTFSYLPGFVKFS